MWLNYKIINICGVLCCTISYSNLRNKLLIQWQFSNLSGIALMSSSATQIWFDSTVSWPSKDLWLQSLCHRIIDSVNMHFQHKALSLFSYYVYYQVKMLVRGLQSEEIPMSWLERSTVFQNTWENRRNS